MAKVSLIIPSYTPTVELRRLAKRCISSLKNDDLDEVLIIEGSEETSYASAVNDGLRRATGDVLIVGNNDLLFTRGWLEAILKPLDKFDIISLKTSDQGWEIEDKVTEDDKFGALFAMKRKVYKKVGGFDAERFPDYFTDLDYHVRAKEAGFRIGKNHGHVVQHVGKATFSEIDPDDTKYYKGMEAFKEKYGRVW